MVIDVSLGFRYWSALHFRSKISDEKYSGVRVEEVEKVKSIDYMVELFLSFLVRKFGIMFDLCEAF